VCIGGNLVCEGEVGPQEEECNGEDDDCDGEIDEGNPGGGERCGTTDIGICEFGQVVCVGGSLRCRGNIEPEPFEKCDDLDHDCDGDPYNGFDFENDPEHCGGCEPCELPRAIATCQKGRCEILSCIYGYIDKNKKSEDGCEMECTSLGVEVCNGEDDDCDGLVDEDDPDFQRPANFCVKTGPCANTEPVCDPDLDRWRCIYDAQFVDLDPDGNILPEEVRCDNIDNDCDGKVDESFMLLGKECGNGVGVCRSKGIYVCNELGTGVECNAPPAGKGLLYELCNNLDDDCDGKVDEIEDLMMEIVEVEVGGRSFSIFAYEASRRDASLTSAGVLDDIPCSRPGVIPWANITWSEANEACKRLGAGWRLCDEADWEAACKPSTCESNQEVWSFDNWSDCLFHQDWCNGMDYSEVEDVLLATGSLIRCRRKWNDKYVYDLSGNLKEWTYTFTTTQSGEIVYKIRGGSYNNTQVGISCNFDFFAAGKDFSFPNLGFRCCKY
jgi:hypothetical protein